LPGKHKRKNEMNHRTVLGIASIIIFLSGCASTQQGRDIEASGFLGKEASQLLPGEDGDPLLLFLGQSVDWKAYRKIKLDPITIWAGEGSAFEDFSGVDQQTLADTLFSNIHQQLSEDYEMVDELDDGVLHVQVALTDAQKSNPFLDTISTIHPTTLVLSQATGLATGKPAFVGEASVEARFLDGKSGAVLAAAADRRVGNKSIDSVIDSWDDVQASFHFWASQLRYRLCVAREDEACEQPEA